MRIFSFSKKLTIDTPTFIIAEIGVNHNGSMEMARKLIDEAARAGADAVKFQTFKADMLSTNKAPKAQYQIETDGHRTQKEMLKALELGEEEFRELARYTREKHQLEFISSPFDPESALFLETLDVNVFKLPSGEITNYFLLKTLKEIQKPIIMSTGMASFEEIRQAIDFLELDPTKISMLHCVSCYPTKFSDINLKRIQLLQEAFPNHLIGFSDHSTELWTPVLAVSLGARIIEKHFTLDKTLPGPDHRASLDPTEFKAMVDYIRSFEKMIQDAQANQIRPCEEETKRVARKSLVASRDLPAGITITEKDLAAKRPETGINPMRIHDILGKTLKVDLKKDDQIHFEHVD